MSRSTASVARASFCEARWRWRGAVYGAGAVEPFVSDALASGTSDLAILNFALTLEYLETDFYKVKAKAVGLSGEAKSLAAMFADQEQEHVGALTQAIKQGGGTPVKKPTFVFPVTNQAGFLKLAYVLENTGVGAYNGAGSVAERRRAAGRGRLDRPGRGAPRGLDRPADRPVGDARTAASTSR